MWCAACRADVAAELSADNRRMLCARCHSELGTAVGALDRVAGSRSQDTERNARELLARWSTQHLLDPPLVATTPLDLVTTTETATKPAARNEAAIAVPRSVVVSPEQAQTGAPSVKPADRPKASHRRPSDDDGPDVPPRRRKARRPRLADSPEPAPASGPTPDEMVRLAVQNPAVRAGNWTTSAGQLCAYGGVALLTLGTVMVLSGYFGIEANYAPTGWLVATVGQMLLFLGVVTLVSGGMEQTVDEVTWRIDHLAEQILHLERTIAAQESQRHRSRDRRSRRHPLPRQNQSDAA